MTKFATLWKLARVGLAAIDASQGYRFFGPYEGLGTANSAMERVAEAMREVDLSMGEIEDAKRDLSPELWSPPGLRPPKPAPR
jgi:hypothetical protein